MDFEENLWCLLNLAKQNSVLARHNVKIPVGFSCSALALQDFLQCLWKFLQALQIFVDADIDFCEFLCYLRSSSFVSLSFINEWE